MLVSHAVMVRESAYGGGERAAHAHAKEGRVTFVLEEGLAGGALRVLVHAEVPLSRREVEV